MNLPTLDQPFVQKTDARHTQAIKAPRSKDEAADSDFPGTEP